MLTTSLLGLAFADFPSILSPSIYLSPTGPRSSDKNHGGVKEDTWIAQIVDVRAVDSHNVFM